MSFDPWARADLCLEKIICTIDSPETTGQRLFPEPGEKRWQLVDLIESILLSYYYGSDICIMHIFCSHACFFLAATSSSRNTPWLLLLLLLLRIMMMLPLIINSYNLVSFHQNLMKLVLNWRISHCLSFPGNNFLIFFFLEKSDFSVLKDLEKFQPW